MIEETKYLGVFVRDKLVFVDKHICKIIDSIEKILTIIFACFYKQREDDNNLLYLFKRICDRLGWLKRHDGEVLVLELNTDYGYSDDYDGFEKKFPASCRLLTDDEFDDDKIYSSFKNNMYDVAV